MCKNILKAFAATMTALFLLCSCSGDTPEEIDATNVGSDISRYVDSTEEETEETVSETSSEESEDTSAEEALTEEAIETTAETTSETTSETTTVFEEITSADIPEFSEETATETEKAVQKYYFRSEKLFDSHYEKHGAEFGDITQDEYLDLANELINAEGENILHKTEKEDGDFLYYDTETNEFLVLSTDGYIRTFFKPSAGLDYWERQ